MPLDAQHCLRQMQGSYKAAAKLNASCQALLNIQIQADTAPWLRKLDQELGAAQALASSWREQGMSYHRECLVDAAVQCGSAFAHMQPDLERLFSQLEQHFSMATQMRLAAAMATLPSALQLLLDQDQAYASRLRALDQRMADVQARMRQLIQIDSKAMTDMAPSAFSEIPKPLCRLLLAPSAGSTSLWQEDLNLVLQSHEALRASWLDFKRELTAIIQRLQHAQSESAILDDHARFRAVSCCWEEIAQHAPSSCQDPVQCTQTERVS